MRRRQTGVRFAHDFRSGGTSGLAGVVICIIAVGHLSVGRTGSEILTVLVIAAVFLLVWRVRRPRYGRIA